MLKKIQFLLCMCIVQCSFSQEVEFGKISKEELLEKSYSKDESANAVVLYKNKNTYFNSSSGVVSLVTQVHERIKIYNKEGFDYATKTINLYKSRSDKERVSKIKAYTYNLEGSKIVKTELDKDQIFDNEYSYNYDQVKFTLPNVKEGSVIEFKYDIKSPFYWNIDEYRFQYDIPIKKLEAQIRTPKGFKFNQIQKGYIRFHPSQTQKTDHRLGMTVDILTYTLADVPALKEENLVNNINNYRAGVMFELVSIEFTGQKPKYFSKTWGDVAKTIGNTDDYKKQLDKTKSFDETLDDVIADKLDNVEKMKSIFKYAKDNINWNGIDGKYFYNGIKKTLKEKKGNVADINLTLVAMLRYAGLNANPLVISTKENLVPFFPTVDRLNYVLAYVVINNKQYFLDATDEFSDINLLPIKDYNGEGILVNNNKMVWKKVGIKRPEPAIGQYVISANLSEEGAIEGSLKSRFKNHNAYKFRQSFKDADLDAFITEREKVFENIEISNYEAKNTDDYNGYVSESFEFYKESGADVIDNKIYIQPLLFLKLVENPFKLDKREYPIDFGHPLEDHYIVNITIPEGYTLESSPKPIVVKIPNNLGEFKYLPKVVGNKILLSAVFEIKDEIMYADSYLFLKEFFNQIINKEAEQIVLTKV